MKSLVAASVIVVGLMHAQSVAAQGSAPKSPTGIDYSFAGYGGGGVSLPRVAAVLTARPTGSDDTALLQGALDRLAAMPLRADGFRGALLLGAGRYRVNGQLHMRASGVVLRGVSSDKTLILAEGLGRRSLIEIGGTS